MSSSNSLSPSPELILNALQSHLIPYPILSYLPTVLNLFAHLQLLSQQIQGECTRASETHKELVRQLRKNGYSDKEQVLRGALSEREGNDVQIIRENRERAENEMLAFSLEFRKHHIATLLSTLKIPLGQVQRISEAYFPNLNTEGEGKSLDIVKSHPALYIRCMTLDQISIFNHYESVVKEWYGHAKDLNDNDKPPPSYTDFYPKDKDNGKSKQDSLCKNLLKEAEKVLEDVRILQSIFSDDDGEDEVEADQQTVPAEGESSIENQRFSKAEKGKGEEFQYTGAAHQRKGQAVMQDSTSNQNNGPSSATYTSSRPPESGFVSTNHRSELPVSRTPSSASRTKQARTAPQPQSCPLQITQARTGPTSHPQRSNDYVPEVIDLTDIASANSQSQSRRPFSSPKSNTTQSDRPKTLPSGSTAIPISTPTMSANNNRKPRQSYPSTGPEYTSPIRLISNTVKKERLRPFDNSDLQRAKRAKV